jgi:HD-GYP domain-containing protein (c-di-GMP phosphodiesterase class II)
MSQKEREKPPQDAEAVQMPSHAQAQQAQEGLRRMSAALAVPIKTGTPPEAIRKEAGRLFAMLDGIGLESMPLLGPRYASGLESVRGTLSGAGAALDRGETKEALKLYEEARARALRLSEVFQVETQILSGGVPPGLPPRISLTGILDAVESTLRDEGMLRARSQAILGAARLYAQNADRYNTDSPQVRAERDALIDFILERGAASREGAAYPEAGTDAGLLSSFKGNARIISEAVGAGQLALASAWRSEISRQLPLVQSDDVAEMLRGFDRELAGLERTLRIGKTVRTDEFAVLSQRFYTLTGTVPPVTHGMRLGAIREGAMELSSGPGRAQQFSAAWFGEKALEALDAGDAQAAALAFSAGMLERAAGSHGGGAAYLTQPLHAEIREAVARHRATSPQQMSHFLSTLQSATLHAECDRIESEAPVVGTPGRRETATLIRDIVAETRRRAAGGDMDSARRLFEMADGYERLIKANGWSAWPGSAELESALRAELGGSNGTAPFERGLAYQAFAGEAAEFRKALGRWGEGLAHQQDVLGEALDRTAGLASEGRFAEARRILTCAIMYADGVVRLSVDGRGRPSSLDPHVPPEVLGRMESALLALTAGEGKVGTEVAEDLFMRGYSECMQTSITLQASALASAARQRPAGQETILGALDEAKKKGEAGDFRGAMTLLAYVEDYYGARTPNKAGGWRYAVFDASFMRDADGMRRGRDGMLSAIEAEMRAMTPGDHASAASLFGSSLTLVTVTAGLISEAAILSRKFAGEIPLIDGKPSTKDSVPMGVPDAQGGYPRMMPLAQVREYEAAHTDDPALGKGPLLSGILANCRAAARSGDAEAYNAALRAFEMRFELVVGRAANEDAFSSGVSQLGQMASGLAQMRKVYGEGEGRDGAIVALAARAQALRARLEEGQKAHGQFPAGEYSALISDVAAERRLALGYSIATQQISLGRQYIYCVSGERGESRDEAMGRLAESQSRLERARALIVLGDAKQAAREYNIAAELRIDALVAYRADNQVNFGDVVAAHRRRPGLNGIDERFFPTVRLQRQYNEFSGYLAAHNRAFGAVLGGDLAPGELERIGKGTILIESSIFGVPADAPSQFFDSFASEQAEVRRLVSGGDLAGAEKVMSAMQERAETNRWVANAALIGVGIASAFIPVAGIWISGSIFTGMAVDRIETEYRRDGHASTEAWLMLGLTIGTLGFGGAALATARTARAALAAGGASRATQLANLSRTFTYANLGIGSFMFGYMGASTWNTYQDYLANRAKGRDVILSAGMTLFPAVHMSVSGVSSYRARMAAARAGRTLPIDPSFDPEPGPGRRITPTELPGPDMASAEGVFSFMQQLAGADAGAKAVAQARLARMPQPVRAAIEGWMGRPGVVRSALDAGAPNDLALSGLRAGIEGFRPYLQPVEISGTPAQNDILWLTDPANLSSFVRDLLTPDAMVGGRGSRARQALAARDAARFVLGRIRAENPEAAGHIDRLLSGGGYGPFRQALLSRRPLNPEAMMTLRNASVQLGATLPEGMQAQPMAMAVNESPRASAGSGDRGRPGAPAEGPRPQVSESPAGGGPATTGSSGGKGRAKAPGAPGEAPKTATEKTAEKAAETVAEAPGAKKIQLSATEAETFVEAPKRAVRGLGLDAVAEDVAVKNIEEEAWLVPSRETHFRMNLDRAGMRAKMDRYFRDTARELGWSPRAIDEYADSFLSLLDISERNGYTTYGHTMRVAEYTDVLLRDIDMPPAEKAKIRMAALIHDVGKIGVPNDMWRAPGRPVGEDKLRMEAHAAYSETIAKGLFRRIGLVDEAQFNDIANIAKCHQERFDGHGYPDRLYGSLIPRGARLIALADTYDAIVAERAYSRDFRGAEPHDFAISQIRQNSGSQFDPEFAPVFLRHFEHGAK